MKNKWLRGDNSVNIPGMIMVIVHCPFSYCLPSIYKLRSITIPFVPFKIWPGQATLMKNC